MHLGHRHQLLRKRGDIPTVARSKRLVRIVDMIAYIVSFSSLFFTLDQARLIYIEHKVIGVSLLTWIFYAVSSSVWFFYGYIHKDRVLLVTNFCWILVNISIVVGVLVYR